MKHLISALYIGLTIAWCVMGWRLCRELRDERDQ